MIGVSAEPRAPPRLGRRQGRGATPLATSHRAIAMRPNIAAALSATSPPRVFSPGCGKDSGAPPSPRSQKSHRRGHPRVGYRKRFRPPLWARGADTVSQVAGFAEVGCRDTPGPIEPHRSRDPAGVVFLVSLFWRISVAPTNSSTVSGAPYTKAKARPPMPHRPPPSLNSVPSSRLPSLVSSRLPPPPTRDATSGSPTTTTTPNTPTRTASTSPDPPSPHPASHDPAVGPARPQRARALGRPGAPPPPRRSSAPPQSRRARGRPPPPKRRRRRAPFRRTPTAARATPGVPGDGRGPGRPGRCSQAGQGGPPRNTFS